LFRRRARTPQAARWLAWAHDYDFRRNTVGVALSAGVTTLLIVIIGAVATYIDNYYITSAGQRVANDLRIRIYENLHRLSLGYYDNVKTGALMGRDAQPYPFGILPRNNQ
jgi:subfamily B ATP-binding cassette protein MsbA